MNTQCFVWDSIVYFGIIYINFVLQRAEVEFQMVWSIKGSYCFSDYELILDLSGDGSSNLATASVRNGRAPISVQIDAKAHDRFTIQRH
jgi:hypothetical protein